MRPRTRPLPGWCRPQGIRSWTSRTRAARRGSSSGIGTEVASPVRHRPRRCGDRGRAQRRPDAADELDHGEVGTGLPPRAAGPDPESGTSAICSTPCGSSEGSTTAIGPIRASRTPPHCARCPHPSPIRRRSPASTYVGTNGSAASCTRTHIRGDQRGWGLRQAQAGAAAHRGRRRLFTAPSSRSVRRRPGRPP